jgi:tRNA-2-methylthio-N6-dimethylallyladenosine synthase
VREARFSGAFTFLYSQRPGTPAASMDDQLPHAVVQERYERLVELVNEIAWDENKQLVGRRLEVLVAEGEGRKDDQTARLSGRARDNRLVHFTPDSSVQLRPGDFAEVEVTYGAPHHLVSDVPVTSVRRTRAGDAWEARAMAPTPTEPAGVSLGMPTIGVPNPLPVLDAPACSAH